jgi:hypothetical protein
MKKTIITGCLLFMVAVISAQEKPVVVTKKIKTSNNSIVDVMYKKEKPNTNNEEKPVKPIENVSVKEKPVTNRSTQTNTLVKEKTIVNKTYKSGRPITIIPEKPTKVIEK